MRTRSGASRVMGTHDASLGLAQICCRRRRFAVLPIPIESAYEQRQGESIAVSIKRSCASCFVSSHGTILDHKVLYIIHQGEQLRHSQ